MEKYVAIAIKRDNHSERIEPLEEAIATES